MAEQLTHEQLEQLADKITALSEQRLVAVRERNWKAARDMTEQMKDLHKQYLEQFDMLSAQARVLRVLNK